MSTAFLLGLALTAAAPIPKDELARNWGTPVDPDGDCRFRVDMGALRIVVPGKPHILSGELGATNAPRVVREVSGDFTAGVKVTGKFPADDTSLVEGRWAFYGAGLLVWADEKNYIRFERARMKNPRTGWRCYPSWELRQNGVIARGWSREDGTLDEEKPAYLKVVRKGNIFSAAVSPDGKEWRNLPPLTVTFGRTVKVGVAALQNTAAGYEPVFENLSVKGE